MVCLFSLLVNDLTSDRYSSVLIWSCIAYQKVNQNIIKLVNNLFENLFFNLENIFLEITSMKLHRLFDKSCVLKNLVLVSVSKFKFARTVKKERKFCLLTFRTVFIFLLKQRNDNVCQIILNVTAFHCANLLFLYKMFSWKHLTIFRLNTSCAPSCEYI